MFTKHTKKAEFIVRIVHAGAFFNSAPMTLEDARYQAKAENDKWVRWWSENASGSRPRVEIWEFVEVFEGRVRGVDQ